MLEKILTSHLEEVQTRLRYRQTADEVAKDLFHRGVITLEQFDPVKEEMEKLSNKYNLERMTKTNGPKNI